MTAPVVHERTGYAVVEREPPEVLARNLRVGSLRVLNNADLWRPKGVTPPLGLGTGVLGAVLLSVGASWLAFRARRAAGTSAPLDQERLAAWRMRGVIALVLALVALVLQFIAYATLDFGPSSGGYASVYVGWTGLYAVFVLGGFFWLETLVATSFRYRKTTSIEAGHGAGDRYRTEHDVEDPLALVLPGLQAFLYYWVMLAVIGVVTYILLYAVR